MAVPTKYNPSYSYSGFESVSPASPKPGAQLDNDFAQIEQSIGETIDGLSQIRRSDGALANGVVTPDSLSAGLVMGFTVEGAWTDGTIYDAADGVTYGTSFYKARVAHTAAPATRPDLSPTTWAFLFTFDSIAVGDNSITTVKIVDGAVTTPKLADAAVSSAKIADGAVTAAKIGAGEVLTTKLVDGAVTAVKLASDAVTTVKILDANVTGAKLADASVDTAKIVDAAVTFAKMATAALTSIYAAARTNILALANTWTGVQTISTNALDLAVGQIKFPATQNPSSDANTLDDYIERSFTPAYSATGCTFNPSSQVGSVTKVGNRVWGELTISLNSSGNTLNGNALTITGLPYTAGASTGSFLVSFTNASSSLYSIYGVITSGDNFITLRGLTAAGVSSTTGAGTTAAANALLNAAAVSIMRVSFAYRV